MDLRGSEFGELIGFEENLVEREKIGLKLPNITNSIDVLYLNTDSVSDSLVDGISRNTIAVIPTDNLRRSFPFTFHGHCQQTQEIFMFQKLEELEGDQIKKKKKTGKRQWASSRKEQSIQQRSDFRRNILRKARARGLAIEKPLSRLDLNDWVKELGIKKFRGVFSRDNLPKNIRKEECGIINLDDFSGPGTH